MELRFVHSQQSGQKLGRAEEFNASQRARGPIHLKSLNKRKEIVMETVEEARARATAILRKFSISEELLRVLDPDERPRKRAGERSKSDGRYYGNNRSFYQATYCVHVSHRSDKPHWITGIEVRQDFNAKKLSVLLEILTFTAQRIDKVDLKTLKPFGHARVVRTRKPHPCAYENCAREIPAKSAAVTHTNRPPGEPFFDGYRRHFHRDCYELARAEVKYLPSVSV
jgi:hypothetical protein